MAGSKEAELVDVHHLWKHEAHDFTPWLAKNLDLLGKELGLNLKLVSQETPVGPFSLDILARDDDRDALVAIENQLEPTNHTHLGQLLLYAAGCKAGVAIWIAPEFGYHHAEALHELNRWTTEAIRFFGVKVEAVLTADGSQPKPKLRKVVYPGGWNKELTTPSGEESLDVKQHRDFFEPMIDNLLRSGFSHRLPILRFNHTGRHFRSPLNPGIWYSAQFEKPNSTWVNLHIEFPGNTPLTKHIFDTLLQKKREIEAAIPPYPALEWDWRRYNHLRFSTINIRRNGSILDSQDKQIDTQAWMLALLPKLKDEFDPRVAAILEKTASQDKTDN